MNHPAHTYRQHAVQGATPVEMVVMLYDGAIAWLQRAMTAIESNDIERKCAHLNRALAIIGQLEGTLDFERGGEVAQTLKQLYLCARAQVLKANIQNSPEILRSLIQNFVTVREAWCQAQQRLPPSPTTPANEGSHHAPSPARKLGAWRLCA